MLFDKILGLFSRDLAIDLGTANTIVISKDKGVIINEPSVVALQLLKNGKKRVLAVGSEAKEMLGKTPDSIVAIRPMKDGVIADFDAAEDMIRYFIVKAHNGRKFSRPRVIICVPHGLTQVERRAVEDSAYMAGARGVYLVEEPKVAALGAGLPTKEPKGSLVIDIGGGTTEIGVISMEGLVRSKSLKVAGDRLDQTIIDFIKKKHNLIIGERTGEKIKIEIGSAMPLKEEMTMKIKGRDQLTGLLKEIEITSQEIREAIATPLAEISLALKDILEDTPTDLAGDIIENGIALTGGGALLKGIDIYLSKEVELPIFIAEDPLLSVARGTGMLLDDIDLLEKSL